MGGVGRLRIASGRRMRSVQRCGNEGCCRDNDEMTRGTDTRMNYISIDDLILLLISRCYLFSNEMVRYKSSAIDGIN